MPTIIIDTGEDIVGIFFVERGEYVPYRGQDIRSAIHRIGEAEEVVTYNGKNHDLEELRKFAGLPDGVKLSLQGDHTDMRSVCWSDRIWGKSLADTYAMHFTDHPSFPDTHEGSNECDVYMTFKLWELWKKDRLMILDGHDVLPLVP